jgi:predicted nucleic acid-binding protein
VVESTPLRVALYLDASALAKIILDCRDEKDGRKALRDYLNRVHKTLYTTPICFAETIGLLKRKFLQKNISKEEYIDAYKNLMIHFFPDRTGNRPINLEQVEPAEPETFKKAARIVEENKKIDFGDAMQIITLVEGMHSGFHRGPSAPLLITADKKLAKVAREKGAKAWYIINEPPPD